MEKVYTKLLLRVKDRFAKLLVNIFLFFVLIFSIFYNFYLFRMKLIKTDWIFKFRNLIGYVIKYEFRIFTKIK